MFLTKTFTEVRNKLQELFVTDTKSYIKAVISIETAITDEDELERLYQTWLQDDSVTSLLHESFNEYI